MTPSFQLWDSEAANLVGTYESVSEVLADLEKKSTTIEARAQIRDLVLTSGLGGTDGESVVILDGETLYRLCLPIPALAS